MSTKSMRLTSVILAFVLVCASFVMVSAEGGLKFEIKPFTISPGSDVDVVIAIKNNPDGCAAGRFDLTYDPAIMTPKAEGSNFTNHTNALMAVNASFSTNKCRVVFASATNIEGVTNLVTLHFTAKSDVESGTSVSIGLDQGDIVVVSANPSSEDDPFVSDPDVDPVVDVPTDIVVKPAYKNGDINADGYADVVDAMLALQYDAEMDIGISADGIKRGDVNKDGSTDVVDAMLLLQHDAEMDTPGVVWD